MYLRYFESFCFGLNIVFSVETTDSDYLKALRMALIDNLKEKCKQYSSKEAVLQCIFELNNLDYIVKSDSALRCFSEKEMESLRKQVVSLKRKYLSICWGPLVALLTKSPAIGGAASSGLIIHKL